MDPKNNIPLYTLSNIEHGYNNEFRLTIPELIIEKGISLGLTGPNGSGKTTLLKILALLEKPDKGVIQFNGETINKKYDNSIIKNSITLLLQEPYLLKRSIFDNVAYGLKLRGEKRELKEKVYYALNCVGLQPEKFAHRKWFELSGGEAHRVALASRIILKPQVLLLDEPVSNIDKLSAFLIKQAIINLRNEYHTSLIISSHDHIWLNSITDNILRIYDGKIIGSGVDNIIDGPWHLEKDGLWATELSQGIKIFSNEPPDKNGIAILNPSDIIISDIKQSKISAQNMLQGTIINMAAIHNSTVIKIDVKVQNTSFVCNVTQHAVNELGLFPGKDVWIIFKASSIRWY